MTKIKFLLGGILALLLSFTFTPMGVDAASTYEAYNSLRSDSYSPISYSKSNFASETKSVIESNFDTLSLVFPVVTPEPIITSRIGSRWGKIHAGVDISKKGGNSEGTPLVAVAKGIAINPGYSPSWGNTLILYDTSRGLYYRYAHMQNPPARENGSVIKTNDVISMGERVGLIGNTGDSQGAHLHFEIFYPDPGHPNIPETFPKTLSDSKFLKWKETLSMSDVGDRHIADMLNVNVRYLSYNYPGRLTENNTPLTLPKHLGG